MNTVETELGGIDSNPVTENDGDNLVVDSQVLLSPERSQKLDLLLHLISNLSESLVVCGPDGIGKSKVLHQVEERKFATWSVCSITATADLTFPRIQDRLLQSICGDEVHASFEDVDIGLKKKLAQYALNNQYVILLLDAAGALMPGVLTRVCSFAESFGPLRPVFAMTADHLQLMAASDPIIDNCQIIEIPPLTERQCEEFLKNLSGKPTGAIPFRAISAQLVQKVYRESHGVPGEILALLPEISKDGDFRTTSGSFPLTAAIVLVVAFAIGFLLLNGSREFSNESIAGGVSAKPNNSDKRDIAVLRRPVPLSKSNDLVTEESNRKLNASLNNNGAAASAKKEAESNKIASIDSISGLDLAGSNKQKLAQSEQSAVEYRNLDSLDLSAEENGGIQVVEDIEQHVQTISTTSANESHAGISRDVVESLQKPTGELAEVAKPNVQSNSTMTIAKVEKTNGVLKQTDLKAVKLPISGVKNVDWILAQDANKFTLQLVAVQKLDDMVKFVEKYSTLDGLALFRTTKNDQDWYALVYGTYSSLSGAKKEAGKLPRALQNSWPRKLKSVHRSIAKFESRH